MMKTKARQKNLVIGLGNSLSSDDAFGTLVLDRIARAGHSFPLEADLINADTDLINWIDRFQEYSHVILVDTVLDADDSLGRRSEVIALEEKDCTAWPETSPSAHQMSPIAAVRLFRKLYPQADTRITLVAYCTDRIAMPSPEGETVEQHIIDAGARLVISLIS
ncbi:MAG TPA: hydrogenase maturation protease [Acidobacteriota bacterium]|nr:hydrogenase maturation protease [Acidobacteriota bacterium]